MLIYKYYAYASREALVARLPIPGSDVGSWGTVLNQFLSVSHDSTGALIPATVLAAISDESIVATKLSSSVQTNLTKAATALQAADIVGKATTSNLAAVATSGSYNDLLNKPGTTFVALTQVTYDALLVKDPSTLYVITD